MSPHRLAVWGHSFIINAAASSMTCHATNNSISLCVKHICSPDSHVTLFLTFITYNFISTYPCISRRKKNKLLKSELTFTHDWCKANSDCVIHRPAGRRRPANRRPTAMPGPDVAKLATCRNIWVSLWLDHAGGNWQGCCCHQHQLSTLLTDCQRSKQTGRQAEENLVFIISWCLWSGHPELGTQTAIPTAPYATCSPNKCVCALC